MGRTQASEIERIQASASAPHELEFRADGSLELNAAEGDAKGKVPTFTMRAYTGGAMRPHSWSTPVVIDLAGEIELRSAKLPILYDHDRAEPIGHTESVKVDASLGVVASGKLSGYGPAFDRVVGMARNGYPWAVSIGGNVLRREFVEAGKSISVNGEDHEGPVVVVRAIELAEISILSIGADKNAAASVAARAAEGANTMKFAEWLSASNIDASTLSDARTAELKAAFEADPTIAAKAVPTKPAAPKVSDPAPVEARSASDEIAENRKLLAAESNRVAGIRKLCAEHGGHFVEAKAIGDGWTLEATENYILKEQRSTTTAGGPAIHARDGGSLTASGCASAIALAAGTISENDLVAAQGEQVAEPAIKARRSINGVQDMLAMAAACCGVSLPGGSWKSESMIRAAFGSHEIADVVGEAVNKTLLGSYMRAAQAFAPLVRRENLPNFKKSTAIDLAADGAWAKLGRGDELPAAKLTDSKHELTPYTYGKTIKLTREDVVDDDLGAFLNVPRLVGRQASNTVSQVVWSTLMANAGSFFASGNGNLVTGGTSALGVDSLTTARGAFMKLNGPDGLPMNVMPKYLVVPPELEGTARALVTSATIVITGSTAKTSASANPNAGTLEVVVAPELSNTAVHANASATQWYLFADPMDVAALRIGYVLGRDAPTVQRRELPFGSLGIGWEAFIDFGAALAQTQGAYRSAGA